MQARLVTPAYIDIYCRSDCQARIYLIRGQRPLLQDLIQALYERLTGAIGWIRGRGPLLQALIDALWGAVGTGFFFIHGRGLLLQG